MIFFLFDTSAVVKHYKKESGSKIVDAIITYPESRALIPNFCVPEVLAIFEYMHYIGNKDKTTGKRIKISLQERTILRDSFLNDVVNKRLFFPYDLNRHHVIDCDLIHAKCFPMRKPIDMIDKLVIAMAYELNQMFFSNLYLVTADKNQQDVAKALGIKTNNPTEEKLPPGI
ncbi:MAG: hypothetical protein AUJ85_07115 [Elusimicrobia bacterium CG1_02_37_114]|nr:MAG: hypothetical protein AUJ85_07115 [Elusimicrobia bacterium CG1_02_37_114]PIZ13641.1 MAG: hypothetical protein COY53_03755 [Elusimicrobia bacterium CG_4_10_14_0_8_um_filter_37_32]PIZ13643.1 MAG: hypothetical protein COY53_03765 [Elusimicrobia bacterium CG_4_10_14_0_8_um_filter_37_32]